MLCGPVCVVDTWATDPKGWRSGLKDFDTQDNPSHVW